MERGGRYVVAEVRQQAMAVAGRLMGRGEG